PNIPEGNTCENCGPGGGYDPEREPDTPHEGSVLTKVWETSLALTATNNLKDPNARQTLYDAYCPAFITDIDELKTRAIYYDSFISNSEDDYTNQHITFGQFKRVLQKYEGLLTHIPVQEQSIQSILQSIQRNLNQTIERETATKILVQSLQRRYSHVRPFAVLATDKDNSIDVIDTFTDITQQNPYAPYIQKAYNLCLVHGRHTRGGDPVLQETEGTTNIKDPSGKRFFEPKRNITIAETIKILVNMSYSWDHIAELTGEERE
ncbi:hypothetical protein CSB09_04160, partial [Candidatus Gracilibacteria bacterium]